MKYSELELKIIECSTSYYLGTPLISDVEFDLLVDELKKVNPDSKILTMTGWGAQFENSPLDKVPHPFASLAGLPKSKVTTDYWLRGDRMYLPKLDGLSVEIIYEDGVFKQAITRGNGYTGLDVSDKIVYCVPKFLKDLTTISLRGEFVLDYENFEKFYSDSPSPRNVASGILNRKSVDPKELERFTVVVYKPVAVKDEELLDRRVFLDYCLSCGFDTATSYIAEEPKTYEYVFSKLETIYPLDGVVAVPDYKFQDHEFTHDKMYIIDDYMEVAYKVVTDTAVTTVIGVEYNMTRTGKMIPTVIYESVELSGALLSRVAGNNAQFIKDNGIGKGAQIEIVRSGEVIPYIVEVYDRVDPELPKVCPVCGKELVWEGVNLICNNKDCPAKDESKVYHWIKTCGYVDGLGNSLITAFVNFFNITTVKDIYRVNERQVDDMLSYEGIGYSKIKILKDMIRKLKEIDLQYFFVGANLVGLSWKSASKLYTQEVLDCLMGHDKDKMETLVYTKGVMRKTSDDIMRNFEYLCDLAYVIPMLYKVSEEFVSTEQDNPGDKFKVCYTGKTENYKTKKDFYKDLENYIVESDIKTCDYLVCNVSKNSSKEKYAKNNGIKIVTESELIHLIGKM